MLEYFSRYHLHEFADDKSLQLCDEEQDIPIRALRARKYNVKRAFQLVRKFKKNQILSEVRKHKKK